MGNRNTKSSLRNAIIYLNISADSISVYDDKFWSQIFSEEVSTAADVIKSISTQEIRMLRDGSPKNFATLTYKMVERLCLATGSVCNTHNQQTAVMNATRILIRILPCIFEDEAWRTFFEDNFIDTNGGGGPREEPHLVYSEKGADDRNYASYLPSWPECSIAPKQSQEAEENKKTGETEVPHDKNNELNKEKVELIGELTERIDLSSNTAERTLYLGGLDENWRNTSTNNQSLMKTLILSICDLLFCPEFTVLPHDYSYLSNAVDAPPEDLKSLSTCDYVWEPGVGFDLNINSTMNYDKNRSELLRALLACLSVALYETPDNSIIRRNQWIEIFASNDNRHALPLFTSLLNIVLVYKPSRPMLPINNLLFEDNREELVELSIQILIAVLDYKIVEFPHDDGRNNDKQNLFIDYMSRIHRNEDFNFLVKGFSKLLNSRLDQGYLLSSRKQIGFDQELLILFWKVCNLNQRFIQYLLKSNEILEIVVPILYHLNENFQDPSKTALIHIGVFNLLILSGERNFGVKLNKPYTLNVLGNLPEFSGSHADLLIIVFHKLIMYGYDINQLYDFLLTIVANISPYLKGLTMLASRCLIQLFETFSSVFVIFTEPNYHSMVIFLLEIFNNIIQYQFDGNANLVYMILNKRSLFIDLANMSTSQTAIDKVLKKLIKRKQRNKIVENMLIEQEKDDSTKNTNRQFSNGTSNSSTSYRSLATVSSNNLQSKSNNSQSARQEVSLVATPDLNHVTHPIHPFYLDSNEIPVADSQMIPNTATKISIDDILNQTVEGSLETTSLDAVNTSQYAAQPSSSNINLIEGKDVNIKPKKVDPDADCVPETASTACYQKDNKQVQKSNKWKPTSDWLKHWKQSLPLQTVLRMIEVLVPQLEQLNQHGGQDEAEIIRFLQSGTLVGLLPVPHPILIRKYRTNNGSTLWFRACTWGVIYVRNTIWTDTHIRLIKTV